MNWLTSWKKIGIRVRQTAKQVLKRKEKIDPSESLWINCPSCGDLNYKDSLQQTDWICSKCSYYFDKPPRAIIKTFFSEGGTIIEPPTHLSDDPLNFKTDLGSYKNKLAKVRLKEKQHTSILIAKGEIEDLRVHLLVSNFKFLGGSWDIITAEYFLKSVDDAVKHGCDVFVFILKTGGVSMYQGALGLTKVMAGSIIGMQKLKQNNILTFGIGQSKTTGGVLASVLYSCELVAFEKGAHDLTFAGKRISSRYLAPGEEMKSDFGTAEEKLRTGQADLVLERSEPKSTICTLAKIIKKKETRAGTEEKLHASSDTIEEILPKTSEKI